MKRPHILSGYSVAGVLAILAVVLLAAFQVKSKPYVPQQATVYEDSSETRPHRDCANHGHEDAGGEERHLACVVPTRVAAPWGGRRSRTTGSCERGRGGVATPRQRISRGRSAGWLLVCHGGIVPRWRCRQDTPGDAAVIPTNAQDRLEGPDKLLKNKGFEGLYLAQAIQGVCFRLNRGGVELRSEAVIPVAAVPRTFVFDRPFAVFVKKRKAKTPFFAMYVANAELLSKPLASPAASGR